jgi:hypothetical protein
VRACQVLRPRRVAQVLALALLDVLPSTTQTASAPGTSFLSRLNGWPARSPADASPTSSRMPAHGSGSMWLSGRGAGYPTPPPQIPACSFPAPGSRRRSNAIVGLDTTDPQALCFSDMLSPALSPEHASLLAFPSTGRLPSAISAADFSRLCSMLQQYYAAVRLLVCPSTASPPRLPVAARDRSSDCGPNEVSQVPTRSFRA